MPGVARIGDQHSGVCAHGAPCCPHPVIGAIVSGASKTVVEGSAAARIGDMVAHSCPHCGVGSIVSGSSIVIVEGSGVARLGDAVVYPGGAGTIISGSAIVQAN